MTAPRAYTFGRFRVLTQRREVHADGVPLAIGNRAFDVLLALVRRRGQIASKSELMDEVWPGVAVEENNLTTHIAALRRLLGDGEDGNRFILTITGRGYRFVADVGLDEAEVVASAEPVAVLAPVAERHNLPLELSSFIGRETELADIAARLAERRLVTLVGPGGMGKTRIALRAGAACLASFADGVWLVELGAVPDAALVAEAACRALGVPVSAEAAAGDILAGFLRQKRLLLILDTCEHLLDAVAELVAALLRHCPGLRLLATSRAPLGLPGESVLRLAPLAVPEPGGEPATAIAAMRFAAVQLLVQRAADAGQGYELTDEDAPAIAAICRRLDGVPLATELAAARLRMLKPAEIAERLEDIFRLLGAGQRGALKRHQTLRATIAWSHDLLEPEEQVALRRLAVLADGGTLASCVAVTGLPPIEAEDPLDLLTRLVDKSLVVADTSGVATRYRMLETTRQFAAEKLEAAGESAACRHRFAAHMVGVAAEAARVWPVTATASWLARFGAEAESFRAAIAWAFGPGGDPALGVALVAEAGCFAEDLSLEADMRRWTALALPHLGPDTPPVQAAYVLFNSSLDQPILGVRKAPAARSRAIALFRRAGDPVGLSRALRQTGISLVRPDEPIDPALSMLQEAETLLRPLGASKDLATALAHQGFAYFLKGDFPKSIRLNEDALAMRQALQDRSGLILSRLNLAEIRLLSGDTDGAIALAEGAEAASRAAGAMNTRAILLGNLAGYRLVKDDVAGAFAAAMEALALNRALGRDASAILCLEHVALAIAMAGAPETGAKMLGYTDAYFRSTDQVRDPTEQAGHDRLRSLLNASLSAVAVADALHEGAGWDAQHADDVAAKAARDMLNLSSAALSAT